MTMGAIIEVMDDAITERLSSGEAISYRSGTLETAVDVPGIFDSSFVLSSDGELGVIDTSPVVFVRLSALPSDPSNDPNAYVTVDGTVYEIAEARNDGQGGTLLILNRPMGGRQ